MANHLVFVGISLLEFLNNGVFRLVAVAGHNGVVLLGVEFLADRVDVLDSYA